jgi:hypothetical protein
MSTALSSSDIRHSDVSSSGPKVAASWLREPLLHFVLIGAVLFGLDALFASKADDPTTIVIDAEVDKEARQVFESSRGRPPNDQELQALRQVWLDNEVLYREGLAMGLDKGDKSIRDRVIFKALNVVDAGTKRPPYDDKTLQEWFEKNRARYDEPARYDFQEAVLVGEPAESAVRAFVSALNAGKAPDAEAGLRVFTNRPHGNLVQSYGEEFAAALESSTQGEWRAIQNGNTWRAMRLESVSAARPANFEELRGVVLQDWTDATMAEQRSAAVRALAGKYTIKTGNASE